MEFKCPACQKLLTIPDQYANRRMQCPMCKGEFTAPPLSSSASPGGSLPLTPPAAPSPQSQQRVTDFVVPLPGEQPAAPTGPPPPRGQAVRRASLTLSPQVIQWLVPGCLWLVFIVSFFTWVSYAPGGVTLATQSAWGAAFALEPWVDPELPKTTLEVPFVKKEADKLKVEPALPASVPLIFYLLLLVPLIALSMLSVLLTPFPTLVPVALRPLVPHRWLITASLTLFACVLLLLQLWQGFGMESKVHDLATARVSSGLKDADPGARKTLLSHLGQEEAALHRGWWPQTALVLHALALVSCVLVWWQESRPAQPLPRIEVWW